MNRISDLEHLRAAVALAAKAQAKDNHPFGAVLVDADGTVAEGENTFSADGGPGHAEANLARFAARHFPELADEIAQAHMDFWKSRSTRRPP